MGNPLKRKIAKALHRKLCACKAQVDHVFGDYEPSDDTYSAEVQRALENALDKTEALLGHLTSRPVDGETLP